MNTDEHKKCNKVSTKNQCLACEGDCNIINNIKRGKNIFQTFAWITYGIALLIALCFVGRTFWPKEPPVAENISVNFVDAQGQTKKLSTDVQAQLEKQLHSAFITMTQNAENAYNEKFATLLTILTIFGIAWPVIVGLLQFKFNENTLEKITTTENSAKIASDTANTASNKANEASDIANTASKEANKASDTANTASKEAQQAIKTANQASEAAKQALKNANLANYRFLMNQAKNLHQQAQKFASDDANFSLLFFSYAAAAYIEAGLIYKADSARYHTAFFAIISLCDYAENLVHKCTRIDETLPDQFKYLAEKAEGFSSEFDSSAIKKQHLVDKLNEIAQGISARNTELEEK